MSFSASLHLLGFGLAGDGRHSATLIQDLGRVLRDFFGVVSLTAGRARSTLTDLDSVTCVRSARAKVMALKPKEEIGAEVHKLDQFFRVEQGLVRLFSMAFGGRSKRGLQYSSLPARITTSSTPALFH